MIIDAKHMDIETLRAVRHHMYADLQEAETTLLEHDKQEKTTLKDDEHMIEVSAKRDYIEQAIGTIYHFMSVVNGFESEQEPTAVGGELEKASFDTVFPPTDNEAFNGRVANFYTVRDRYYQLVKSGAPTPAIKYWQGLTVGIHGTLLAWYNDFMELVA